MSVADIRYGKHPKYINLKILINIYKRLYMLVVV